MTYRWIAAVFLAGLAAIFACEDSGSATPPDRGVILADLSRLVIVPSFDEASKQAAALSTALVPLRDAPTAEGLTAAREAWKKARRAWKISDAFLFGPSDDLALTGGAIDTATDLVKIEALATGTAPVDLGKLGANQRGLPAIEALLFDPARDDAAMLAAFAAEGHRRGTLAAALGEDLRTKVAAVAAAWTTHAGELAKAGRGSSVYVSERQGVDAVVNALINASEVLIAIRLAKPLGLDKTPQMPSPELIESPRSDTSVEDLLAVLDGIEMVYFDKGLAGTGLPLSAAVAERSPATDKQLRDQLAAARAAVAAIPGPLRTAVVERRDPVIAAHAAVREVKRTFSSSVASALGTQIGFNVTDGD